MVRSVKLLSVTLDDQLTCKQHVTTTVRSEAYRLCMLRRFKSLRRPTDKLRGAYLTFIPPKPMYAFLVWLSFLNSTQQQQLENLLKMTCRVIFSPVYTTYEDALTILSQP